MGITPEDENKTQFSESSDAQTIQEINETLRQVQFNQSKMQNEIHEVQEQCASEKEKNHRAEKKVQKLRDNVESSKKVITQWNLAYNKLRISLSAEVAKVAELMKNNAGLRKQRDELQMKNVGLNEQVKILVNENQILREYIELLLAQHQEIGAVQNLPEDFTVDVDDNSSVASSSRQSTPDSGFDDLSANALAYVLSRRSTQKWQERVVS